MWVASLLIFEQGGMEAGLWLLHGHQRRKSKGEMMLWNRRRRG